MVSVSTHRKHRLVRVLDKEVGVRYFIKVEPWRHLTVSRKISKVIHLYFRSDLFCINGNMSLCGDTAFYGRGGPVKKATCRHCLAILEKQGKQERKEGEDG